MGAKCMFLNSSLPGTFHPKLYAPSKTRCFGVRSNPVRNGSKHDHCEPCCRKNRGSFLVPSFKLALHLHRHHQVWHNNYSCHDETDIYIYIYLNYEIYMKYVSFIITIITMFLQSCNICSVAMACHLFCTVKAPRHQVGKYSWLAAKALWLRCHCRYPISAGEPKNRNGKPSTKNSNYLWQSQTIYHPKAESER